MGGRNLGRSVMNADTQAIIAAALEHYARAMESDARKAGLGTSSSYQLVREASRARHLKSLLEHGSKLP